MAEISFQGIDDLLLSMEEIAEIPVEVQDEMLIAQAEITAEAQRKAAAAYGVQDTGLVIRSIKPGKPKWRKGARVIYITPTGTRIRGKRKSQKIRNAEIAFVNEYGKRGQKSRPFIRKGNEDSAKAATEAAMKIHDRFLTSKNL